MKIQKFQNPSSGINKVETPKPESGWYGNLVRYGVGNHWRWIDSSTGEELKVERRQGDYIYKPNGTRVTVQSREEKTRRAQQAAAKKTTSTVGISRKPRMQATGIKKTSSPIFHGVKAGGTVDNSRLAQISFADKAALTGTSNFTDDSAGIFTDDSFKDVTSLQEALNNYYKNANLGSVKVDGLWGDQTQKAYEMALEHARAKMPKLEISSEPTSSPITINHTPVTTQETENWNRADTRAWLREQGRNPYDLGGFQRRSIRRVHNGDYGDMDLVRLREAGINPMDVNPMFQTQEAIKRVRSGKYGDEDLVRLQVAGINPMRVNPMYQTQGVLGRRSLEQWPFYNLDWKNNIMQWLINSYRNKP